MYPESPPTYGSFDWQTMVTELIQADSTPLTDLQAKETTNQSQITRSVDPQDRISPNCKPTSRRSPFPAVHRPHHFRHSTPSWNATAASGTAAGTYSIDVTHLATAASQVGSQNIAAGLSSTSNVDGLTLATLPTATPSPPAISPSTARRSPSR